MSPAPAQSPAAAPLPPLPDLQTQAGTGGKNANQPQNDAMAALISGLAPVKASVDAIVAAAKQIVQSGAVPGSEQPCAQIIALATSLLTVAAQQALQPGQGGGGLQPIQQGGAQPTLGGSPSPQGAQ